MKYVVALILIGIAAAGLVYIKQDRPENNSPLTGLPWQIDRSLPHPGKTAPWKPTSVTLHPARSRAS